MRPCPKCKGKGSIIEEIERRGKTVAVFKLCPECKGTGLRRGWVWS